MSDKQSDLRDSLLAVATQEATKSGVNAVVQSLRNKAALGELSLSGLIEAFNEAAQKKPIGGWGNHHQAIMDKVLIMQIKDIFPGLGDAVAKGEQRLRTGEVNARCMKKIATNKYCVAEAGHKGACTED